MCFDEIYLILFQFLSYTFHFSGPFSFALFKTTE